MKLHEAMVSVLSETNRKMSTTEISQQLNETGIYTKKDNSSITRFQVARRALNHPGLFKIYDQTVILLNRRQL